MKLKDGFILKNVAENYIVVPVEGELVDLNAMITTTETGALLWKLLENGADREELYKAITDEYDVDVETAKRDVEDFINQLFENKMLEE